MRILFFSHYFPPEVNAPASRTFEHCRKWVEQGHDVTVITCAPNHPRGEVYPGFKNALVSKETVDGVDVIRLWTYITANEGFLKRTLGYISYMVAATVYTPFMPKSDILISTSPQFFNGLAGYLSSKMKRIPWVLEIRDLWPESIVAVGAIKNQKIVSTLEWLEMFAYKKCSHIVPVTDAFKRYMVDKGIDGEKITVIKNGVDLSFYKSEKSAVVEQSSVESIEALQGKFVAAYVGTHGMAHHLETILEAAELLKAEKNIVFLLVGEGAERARLLELKQEKQLDNVIMQGQLPKAAMPRVWEIADLSLVLLRKQDLFKTVIPSKIFESMAMRKPIILGVEGESQAIIEEAGAGFAIEPENAQQLAEKVQLFYNDKALYESVADKGRDFVAKNYDRKTLASRYLDVMENVLQNDKTSNNVAPKT